ncbi:hypothetical protein [Kribbella deserti]|uniref:Uncharacterized protein n=1 Tax=Kribbella deserti TaxID=1926257 RepID=A0ABV6QNC4_9ACTN
MTTHPAFPEQLEDEDWIDWYLRSHAEISDNPPAAPAGFVLIPCTATPRHWPTYTLDDGDTGGDSAACGDCSYADLSSRHQTCNHDINHRAWRQWRAVSWVLGKLYSFGVVSSYGHQWGGGCNRCISGPIKWTLFRGPYVLFAQRETWRCWLAGHRRGVEVGFGYCGKCVPWPCCGSTTWDHADGCPDQTASSCERQDH